MLNEHDLAVLTVPVPTAGLERGDVGTVVHVYKDGAAFELEFVALDGHTRAVVTVEQNHVRPITSRDMAHVREMQTT